jgi:hypothetical protein
MMLAATGVDSMSFARAREGSTGNDQEKRDAKGRFQAGNRFWAARASSSGPAPKFADADALWKACVTYFDWVAENPLYEDRLVTYRGIARHVPVAKMRPMRKGDLLRFIDVAHTTWAAWKRDRADLALTIEHAESVVWCWNFDGAAANLIDANLVIRQLGLGREKALEP